MAQVAALAADVCTTLHEICLTLAALGCTGITKVCANATGRLGLWQATAHHACTKQTGIRTGMAELDALSQ